MTVDNEWLGERRFPGRRLGVLLVHGLSSSPACMRYLAPMFARHAITTHTVLLPGHGGQPEDLLEVQWTQWETAVREGLAELRPECDRLFVLGQSLGGTLALRAAIHDRVDGVLTLSAVAFLKDWRLMFLPVLKNVMRWRASQGNDIAKNDERDEGSYDRIPLHAIQQLVKVARKTRGELSKLQVPALIVHSRVDHVAPPENGTYIYERIASQDKKLLRPQNSYHVISLDYDRNWVAERCIRFMHRVGFASENKAS